MNTLMPVPEIQGWTYKEPILPQRHGKPRESSRQEVQQAFRMWFEASLAWSELNRAVERSRTAVPLDQVRKLKLLEKRVNEAADAYEAVQRALRGWCLLEHKKR